MYTPAAFQTHPALALAFAAARGFGLVVSCEGGRPTASPVPFLITEAHGKTPCVAFHLARANPLAALAEKRGVWLLAVQGADAYVSAGWYASGDQVPTWLYETVHLSGPVRVVPAVQSREHLDALTARFENGLGAGQGWTTGRLEPARLEQLIRAIVVIEMMVESVEGKFKLNQHKADADHVAIADALARQEDPGAHTVAERMVALRPHLMYQNAAGGPAAAPPKDGAF